MPFAASKNLMAFAQENPPDKLPSSMLENFSESLGLFFREDISPAGAIQQFVHRDKEKIAKDAATRKELRALRKEGKIPEEVWKSNRKESPEWEDSTQVDYDYEAISKYAADNGLNTPVIDYSEGADRVSNILAEKRAKAEDVFSRAKLGGKVAQVGGTVAGSLTDPVNILTMPLGNAISAQKGLSIIQHALFQGGLAGVSEAIIQPDVINWKHEIGVEHTNKDAILNIAAATGGGFALEGLLRGLGKTIKTFKPKNQVEADALKRVESFADEVELAKPTGNDALEHAQAMDDQIAKHQEFKTPDVEAKAEAPPAPQPAEEIPIDETHFSVDEATETTRPTREILDEIDAEQKQIKQLQDCLIA